MTLAAGEQAPSEDVTLVTFPPSLDCELTRFVLVHYGVAHREERHTLFFSSFFTLWRGYTLLFPLLCGPSYRLSTARAVVDHFEKVSPAEQKLVLDGPNRQQIEDDWTLFNQDLAFATAIYAYYHLLGHKAIMAGPLADGAPDFEVRAVRVAYPFFAGLLRLLLFLTADRARQSRAKVSSIMSTVDERLAGGKRYLVGDRFSLSDMAFAVGLAPLVLPAGYGGSLPSLSEMPPELQAAIAETRARPAGQFAMRIYEERRTLLPG